MTAHHFFVPPEAITGDLVRIAGEEGHHAARVLRVRVGEAITVADDTGRVVDAVVSSVSEGVEAHVLKETIHAEPKPAITLYQALTKGEKFDDVVQRSAEIGVARIVPFVAERSVVKWDAAKRAKAVLRWSAVARAAAKQSRSPRISVVGEIADDVSVAIAGPRPAWVLHEADGAVPIRRALPEHAPEEAGLVVGPEGGLSDEEIELLRAGGAEIVGLGPRILRTETAGLVAAAIVSFAYGVLG
jgi:16S rRNA (uracil1498-N3)-methyltransferase